MVDFLGSTEEIIQYSVKSQKEEFVVVTESGVLHEMKKEVLTRNFMFRVLL